MDLSSLSSITSLLGSNDLVKKIAKESGVKEADVKKVLAAAVPLIVSKLKDTQSSGSSSSGSSGGLGSLLTGLLK